MEIPDAFKFSDSIPFPKDGNSHVTAKNITSDKVLIQFYIAHL